MGMCVYMREVGRRNGARTEREVRACERASEHGCVHAWVRACVESAPADTDAAARTRTRSSFRKDRTARTMAEAASSEYTHTLPTAQAVQCAHIPTDGSIISFTVNERRVLLSVTVDQRLRWMTTH
jgi:hypothetical protein